MDKIHVHMCFLNASIESTAAKEAKFFPSLFLISTSWFLFLAKAIPNDHVAAFSTALRSANEKIEVGS